MLKNALSELTAVISDGYGHGYGQSENYDAAPVALRRTNFIRRPKVRVKHKVLE